jgi:hypothetical protein
MLGKIGVNGLDFVVEGALAVPRALRLVHAAAVATIANIKDDDVGLIAPL